MTAFPTATAPPTATPRQIRWLLRLHRPAVYTWTVLVVGLAAALVWLSGPLTDAAAAAWHQYDTDPACQGPAPCAYDQDAILRYKDVYRYTTLAVLALPFLVAAWSGAALTGREMETGTARLAWTQGTSPLRWLAARLAVPAGLVTAGTVPLVWLHHLAWSAGRGRIDSAENWYDLTTFYAGGPLTVALALAGLVTGALLGLVLGRSLAALCGSVLATAALWTAVHLTLPHLWPTVTGTFGRGRFTYYPGIKTGEGIITPDGTRTPASSCASDAVPACQALNDRRHATGFYVDYHPYAHYWPLHLVGAAAVLALTAVLTVVAFRLLLRRTTGRRPARAHAPQAAV
ncbi:ABC transporter permease [Streptomyces sp. CSDS2]|uniref:ABC transporter permease n=1 Tax=Streptomyces sp. CSDS2 TaxID=3055051 RepID=UPI0025B23BC6|nr:ABC transporter permease [Streptomyces sp. CSDS2]MDN3259771.1 ABC transporter permease [Streptomyces sp. CSDS2]